MPSRVHIDFETRSTVDLRTCGSTIYAQHWTTSPLMLAYIVDGTEYLHDFFAADMRYTFSQYPAVQDADDVRGAVDCPKELAQHLQQDDVVFVAHNARFEQDIWYWICHKRWGWPMPKHWSCTAARARYWGLRASLEHCAQDLKLTDQKIADGKSFINTFCAPRKYHGSKRNGKIAVHWAEPNDMPLEWEKGKRYCLQDARVEKAIDELLPDLPPFEQRVWEMDFRLNTHGLPIDVDSVAKAIHFSDHYTQNAVQRFNAVTGVNPTQRDKVIAYLDTREEMGKMPNLQSKTISKVLQVDIPPDLRDVLSLRLDCSRASVKKLQAMIDNTSGDGFARGLFMYYGAHTGRWSAKRIQPHNFIRGHPKQADVMFKFLDSDVWAQGISGILSEPKWVQDADLLFPRPLKALSHSMRGFIKAPDNKFILSGDYAQIEARVLAWLAGCNSLLQAYRRGEDVYVRFAADFMYHRRYDDYFDFSGEVLDRFKHERQRAKSAVLGCGFQLGAPGFQAYCDAQDIIITLEEAEFIVNAYRAAYPEISDWDTGLWSRVNYCAIQATVNEGSVVALYGTPVTFTTHRIDAERWWLICNLPSGRHIAYFRPKVEIGAWNKPVLRFIVDWHGQQRPEYTYGGKITENIVQGIARDICALGAINAYNAGFDLAALIHDEVIAIHACNDNDTKSALKDCLLSLPTCYDGLPLDAEVKAMRRYAK